MQGTLTFLSLDLIGPGFIYSNADLIFTNTTITGLSNSPGGNSISIQANNITISDSIIHDNPSVQSGGIFLTQAECSFIVSNSAFYNNTNNGIIFFAQGSTSIDHCTFTRNQLYAMVYETDNGRGDATLAISSTSMSNNVFSAAAIDIGSCRDISLTAISYTANSGVLLSGGSFGTTWVAHSTITSNSGGAIVLAAQNGYFFNNTFSENSNSYGLLTFTTLAFSVQVESCNFTSNSAINAVGAAIYSEYAGDTLTILSCTFINNTSDEAGGAIYLNDAGNAVIYSSTFTNNSAPSGGAIYAWGGVLDMTIQASTFTRCSATSGDRFGGAVFTFSYLQ